MSPIDPLGISAVQFRKLHQWAAAHHADGVRQRRVVKIAQALFSLTRDRHQLPANRRRLLLAAGLLHDLGHTVTRTDCTFAGAHLILSASDLDLNVTQRRALAFMSYYHRDPVPPPGDELIVQAGDDAASLRILLALLQASVALEKRTAQSRQVLFAMAGNALSVMCFVANLQGKLRRPTAPRQRFALLEELMHCRVGIELKPVRALVA